MIVWSGRGFLAVLVLILCIGVFANILPKEQSDFAFVLTFLATGAFCWFMGKKWNEETGRTFVDKATGQEFEVKGNHSLFWIKLQYWGPIFGVVAIVILVQSLF